MDWHKLFTPIQSRCNYLEYTTYIRFMYLLYIEFAYIHGLFLLAKRLFSSVDNLILQWLIKVTEEVAVSSYSYD